MPRTILGTAALLAAAAAFAHADLMYGVDASTDALYIMDSNTGGIVRYMGRLGGPNLNAFMTPVGMAAHPLNGQVYITNNSPDSQKGVWLADTATGHATWFIGNPNIDGSITFDHAGVLYAQRGSTDYALVRLDTSSGTVTVVSGTSLPRCFGLTYRHADGLLYGVITVGVGTDATVHLARINRSTGALVGTVPVTLLGAPVTGVPGALEFDSHGTLVMTSTQSSGTTNDELFHIDPGTGIVTRRISMGFFSPQGMALVRDCVRDPAVEQFTGGTHFDTVFPATSGDTVGWRFSVNQPVIATHLGVYDDADNNVPPPFGVPGLDSTHAVAMWDPSGTMLAVSTVSPTSNSVDGFHYTPSHSVQLRPEATYTIGAMYTLTDFDAYVSSPPSIFMSPDVTHLGGVSPAGPSLGLSYPTVHSPTNKGRFGPNFLYFPGEQYITDVGGGFQLSSHWFGTTAGDTVGYRFEVLEPLTVTRLGVWNLDTAIGFPGLTSEHMCGIWDAAGTLVTSTRVSPLGVAVGEFVYSPTEPASLLPGQIYTIGAEYREGGAPDFDNFLTEPSILFATGSILHRGAVAPAAANLGFTRPTVQTPPNLGRFGPNFIFTQGALCPCPADLTTPDCETNINDFFEFLALYQAADPRADFAPGGGVDVNDYFAYLAAYQLDRADPDCNGG